jgi:proton-dependent oligopeptide transporter, POT family
MTTKKELFGHPIGLFVLFLTEMWERFSFYGMKALMIFYLVKHHLFSDDAGNLTVGSYAALVYAMPVLGGFLADKYLGFRKAVIFGGILLVLGHLGLAFEGNQAIKNIDGTIVRDEAALQFFYFSLALIIMGVGFLKANISSIVGELYEKGDKRRDSGFTIFYMGINLGAMIAVVLCGWLGETYGWGYGFGAAGIGMLLGLITFIYGQKYFMGKAEPKDLELIQRKTLGISTENWIYTLSFLGTFAIWQMVQNHSVVENLLLISGFVSLLYIIYYMLTKCDKVEKDRLIALTILILFSVIFWALFEQSYTSMNLFADRVLDRTVFGTTLTASFFLSFNSLFIILFAPLFAWLWVKLASKNLNPNAAIKFGLGIILVGIGFGVLDLGITLSTVGKVGIIWLVLAYMFHTWGELCVSPVGLSYVTKLSPGKIVGFMMGVWFLATASSEYIASILANIASVDTSTGDVIDIQIAKAAYANLFGKLFYSGLFFGVILLIASPFINKLTHKIDSEKTKH